MIAVDLGMKENVYISLDSDFETANANSVPLHSLSLALPKSTAGAVNISEMRGLKYVNKQNGVGAKYGDLNIKKSRTEKCLTLIYRTKLNS
jgi:hypothetical protein